MNKKINKTQIMASLALAFALGLSMAPMSAFATEAESRAVDTTTTTTTTADDWKLEEATPEQLVAAINSVSSHFGYFESWSAIVGGVQYLEDEDCGYASACPVFKESIIKNVPTGTDTTDWNTKSVYELIPLAKATTGYDTNTALKAVVEEAEKQIDAVQLEMIVQINKIDDSTSVSELKSKTIPELIAIAEALPDYDKYEKLIAAYDSAIVFHSSILPSTSTGAYVATAETATYYNNLVAAARAIDPKFTVTAITSDTPKELPETSAPATADTKAPNTGNAGMGENKTAIAMIGGVVALGAVGIVIAARKTLKSKARGTRKF